MGLKNDIPSYFSAMNEAAMQTRKINILLLLLVLLMSSEHLYSVHQFLNVNAINNTPLIIGK